MTTKHTTLIRLQSAENVYVVAQECCPHWDMESAGDEARHECCYALDEAQREVNKARIAHNHAR